MTSDRQDNKRCGGPQITAPTGEGSHRGSGGDCGRDRGSPSLAGGTRFISTDNAYIRANQIEISAQVSGLVSKLHVRDQVTVRAGDPLFDIDPRNYEQALRKARAQLELARLAIAQLRAGVSTEEAVLAQRRAEAANARGN